MKKNIRIAIVDHYKILREALSFMLSKEEGLEVVGEAENGLAGYDLIRNKEVDVMVLESLIPEKDGIDLTRDIISMEIPTKVLVLTMDTGTHNAFRMLRAGAAGWLPKTSGFDEVIHAIRMVSEGKVYLPPALQQTFAQRYVRPESIRQPEEKLSEREYQVMRLLAMGNTNREISERLCIGVKTVDTHRANLLRKLDLRNNADLTRFAIQNNLVKF